MRLLRQHRRRRRRRRVTLDNAAGIDLLVDHLREHGHSRIALLAGSQRRDERRTSGSTRSTRRCGATALGPARARARVPLDAGRRPAGDARAARDRPAPDGGRRLQRRARARRASPPAASSASRYPTSSRSRASTTRTSARSSSPPLTAVAYDPAEVGREAAALLVDAMRDEDGERREAQRPRPPRSGAAPAAARTRERARRRRSRSAASPSATASQLALKPTDLEIAEGEFFCLLGPSGCGKTTTLNLIGGFVAPTSGEIYIRERAGRPAAAAPAQVNTVFQSYALFPHMTRARQRRLRAEDGARAGARGGERASTRRSRSSVSRSSATAAGPALGRPAAARRGGAGARQPTRRAPARRAARRARPEASQAAADRALADPPRCRHDVRLRHA